MAKELPYFRFTVSEWLNDDISLESYQLKGVFIDVCCFYWFKDCSITIAMLNKRFNDAREELEELCNIDIVKYNDDNTISIRFLDEQFDMLSEKRIKRQKAGSKGGKQRASNAKAMLKQCSSYKDKDNNKDKDIYTCFDHLSITRKEFDELAATYKTDQIDDILESIQNYKGNKKYKSLYLTAKKWLAKEYPPVKQNNAHLFQA